MAQPNPDMMAAIAVTRFGLGARPGELAAARQAPKAWLKAQIKRTGADPVPGDLPNARERILAFRDAREMRQIAQRQEPDATKGEIRQALGIAQAYGIQEEFLARSGVSSNTTAPFAERWALFFANHFTVSATKGQCAPVVGPFEREVIRPNAFGRFEDMLKASSTHPAMLLYLDQAQSVGPNSPLAQRQRGRQQGLNENLAREILELHTVGVNGGYTQADVTEFARALTGLSVGGPLDAQNSGKTIFREIAHEQGPRTIMGKRYPAGGAQQAGAILHDLAVHPQTARHLARKIATHFVADDPPPALCAKLEKAFNASGGDLSAVADALIDADEAWAPAPAKFKTPYEHIISAHRALGVAPQRPPQILQPLNTLGQPPFRAPSPKGWAEDTATWAAPDAVIKRLTWSADFAGQVANGPRPPLQVAQDALGARLTPDTKAAIIGAESRAEALTLLFMSPEFQRR